MTSPNATPRPWAHGAGLVLRAVAEDATLSEWARATVVGFVPCGPALDDDGAFPPTEGPMPATWAEGYANARLIVRAVNAHDDLVAALRNAADGIDAAFSACERRGRSRDARAAAEEQNILATAARDDARALLARLDAEGGGL